MHILNLPSYDFSYYSSSHSSIGSIVVRATSPNSSSSVLSSCNTYLIRSVTSRRHIAAHCRTLPAHCPHIAVVGRTWQNMAEYGRRHALALSRVLCIIWHLFTQQPYNNIYSFSPVFYFLFLI